LSQQGCQLIEFNWIQGTIFDIFLGGKKKLSTYTFPLFI